MEENNQPQDNPIEYFKSDIQPEENQPDFGFILLDCPRPVSSPLWIIFAIALGIYFVFSIFIGNILLMPMTIEGSSMYPTLNAEYTITGNKYATDVVYLSKTQSVKYEDIIVFNAQHYTLSETDTPVYYIKRVIATAGDTISFKCVATNQLSNINTYSIIKNGKTLTEDYIDSPIEYSNLITNMVTKEQTITIPEGFVFVLGDNRNNSTDSRELGLIKTSDIIGKVVIHLPYGNNIIQGLVKSIKEDYLF